MRVMSPHAAWACPGDGIFHKIIESYLHHHINRLNGARSLFCSWPSGCSCWSLASDSVTTQFLSPFLLARGGLFWKLQDSGVLLLREAWHHRMSLTFIWLQDEVDMNMPVGTDEATLASGLVLLLTPAIPGHLWAIYFEEVRLLVDSLSFGCQKWQCNCTYISKTYLIIWSLCSEKWTVCVFLSARRLTRSV